ncbi:hypothetical protein TNCV_2487651 [Trichonephila clavipes]|uniref:Uncharacterized protein n=1 Tax=Trichonephila clavipes TaxID=2585209 RepID=A0A8X6W061_TRICX|nr:hypothetical protein TNCV_2487651 [Trichonephila clavipes]
MPVDVNFDRSRLVGRSISTVSVKFNVRERQSIGMRGESRSMRETVWSTEARLCSSLAHRVSRLKVECVLSSRATHGVELLLPGCSRDNYFTNGPRGGV